MKCPTCGKEIADDSKFCEFCGVEINPEEPKKEVKEEPAPAASTHKNRFEGCPSVEGKAAPVPEVEEPIKRHGFISFWLGLMLAANVWSIIKTALGIMRGDEVISLGIFSIAMSIVVIIAVNKLYKAEKLGFWMIVGVAIINSLVSAVVGLLYGGTTVLIITAIGIAVTLLSPVILWAILQIKKDGKSYWSQLK